MNIYSFKEKNENITEMTKSPWTVFHPWVLYPNPLFKIISDSFSEPFLCIHIKISV